MTIWDYLSTEKSAWQEITLNEIKSKLILGKNSVKNSDSPKEDHLLLVYGLTQAGKTTLILDMIGIRSDCINDVNKILRAGVPQGDSSTSTAIIYRKSSENSYGYYFSEDNNSFDVNEIVYCEESKLEEYLKGIREKVESGELSKNGMLYIYIPPCCFSDKDPAYNISILDIPGIESKNRKEYIHVENLVNKYIPICSLCIIVVKSNNILSLETVEVSGIENWRRMDHKFVVVITHSYSDASIKGYFLKNTKKDYYTYIKKKYEEDVREILGSDNNTRIYPLDVGDSFNNLYNSSTEMGKEELLEIKNRIKNELIETLGKHKNNRFRMILDDMKKRAEEYENIEKNKIENEINENEKKREELEKKIDINNEYINGVLKKLEDNLKRKSDSFEIYEDIRFIDYDLLRNQIENEKWKNGKKNVLKKDKYDRIFKNGYLHDKNKLLFKYLYVEFIELKNIPYRTKINKNKIRGQIDDILCNKLSSSLYPPKEKVKIERVLEIIENINREINEKIREEVMAFKKQEDVKDKNKKDLLEFIKSKLIYYNKKYSKDISECEIKKEEAKKYKKRLKEAREQDKKTIDNYAEIAKKCYIDKRNEIIKKINSKISEEEKFLNMLGLELLDRDFKNVMGGISDEN